MGSSWDAGVTGNGRDKAQEGCGKNIAGAKGGDWCLNEGVSSVIMRVRWCVCCADRALCRLHIYHPWWGLER